MIILILLFFIISPAIILYTAGYRYDVIQKRLKQTGVVSIDVFPADAVVYFNDLLIQQKMPIRLTNRAPGTYNVRIERPGYRTWHQDITVDSNQTTYIKDVRLFADSLPFLINDTVSLVDVSFAPQGSSLLATSYADGIYVTRYYNVADDTWTTVARSTVQPIFAWSPHHPIASILIPDQQRTRILRFDPTQKSITAEYSLNGYIDAVQWDTEQAIGYVKENTELVSLGTMPTTLAEITSTIWFVDSQQQVWTFDALAQEIKTNTQRLSLPRDIMLQHIISIEENYILAQTLRGISVIDRDTGLAETIPATAVRYDNHFKRWIAWSPIEIWTIHHDGSPHLEGRFSNTTLTNVVPLHSYAALVFSTEDRIEAINPGYGTRHVLFQDIIVQSITADDQTATVYFFGTVGSKRGVFALPLQR